MGCSDYRATGLYVYDGGFGLVVDNLIQRNAFHGVAIRDQVLLCPCLSTAWGLGFVSCSVSSLNGAGFLCLRGGGRGEGGQGAPTLIDNRILEV